MDNNLNTSKIKRFLKNKSTVTALCMLLMVIIIIVGYNVSVNNATKPVKIPVAATTIQPKTEITADKVAVISVPQSALKGSYYSKSENVIGLYSNVNTLIPAGSFFYKEAVVKKTELPDSALYEVPEGETLYYLTVNMLTSYTNSILPGNYIDIYISTKENGLALVGKLLKNVKILAVKTSDGQNVFENSEENRVPYVVIFSLPEEQHLLLRKVNAINNYSIATGTSNFSRIEVIPVPSVENLEGAGQEITSNVTSQYLKDYILNMSAEVPEDVIIPDDQPEEFPDGNDNEVLDQ